MLLYLHLISNKIFFHPSKFDNFKDEKISDFKTVSVSQSKNLLCETETVLGDYEQIFGEFFYVLRVKKKVIFFFLNIVASALKSCIK
jgi:hypothetical protein